MLGAKVREILFAVSTNYAGNNDDEVTGIIVVYVYVKMTIDSHYFIQPTLLSNSYFPTLLSDSDSPTDLIIIIVMSLHYIKLYVTAYQHTYI